MTARRRGSVAHLPLGRYAARDPDDASRWTYWRVEPSGRSKVLRPWPVDERWAPLRPPYPPGLSKADRKQWSEAWYSRVYFVWKEAVIAAIAADPEKAAAEFVAHAPFDRSNDENARATAAGGRTDRPRAFAGGSVRTLAGKNAHTGAMEGRTSLPVPIRVRFRPPAASTRRRYEQQLVAAAMKTAGLSYSRIAFALDLPKATVIRRVAAGRRRMAVGVVSQVVLMLRINRSEDDLLQSCLTVSGPDDVEWIQLKAARLTALRACLDELADNPAGGGV
ncbi:hypothetical protein [Polymorphospora rubra]|uniref:Uncharacterized protein n=1 Tax=Polymorphospora rubra TaxID=338584 RepID=A0A810MX49_9ACTN|nr:hypothetical protein [Polymorphospora rubra]BCJ65130.1 hypothetical protein Prubr_21510 [Polymorphospora rubra]